MAEGEQAAAAAALATSLNQEQLLHELEQKYFALRSELDVSEAERQALAADKRTAALAAKQALAEAEEKDEELRALKEELTRVTSDRDQLSFRAQALKGLAERRLAEIEGLQSNLQEQSAVLIAAQKQEMEALQRVSEQEAQMAPLQHSLTRVRAELDSGKQHTEWLETQLAEKTAALQELRQSAAKHAHEHEETKVELTEELASARRQLENLRLSQKKLDSALIHSKEQLKELQASKLHSEEQFESELNAQRRLAELYKQSAADANSRITELQELCDSLRKSLAESEQALSLETERSKQQVEHLFREQAETSERLVEALQEELREAKERISELEKNKMRALENAAAIGDLSSAAGEAHLAANGLSPKQLVDHIVELEKSLQDERAEKEKLQLYMDRIVKEVQEKTPIIMGLRLDHERAIESHTVLSERFEVCKQELTKSRAKEAQAWKEKQTYEKKCESLAQSVDDLSRQVQHLLFRSQEQHQPLTMRPGEVASENLVVFKDIEELQMRNQQLLTVIRELTEMTKRKRNDGSESESDFGSSSSAHLIISADSDDESADVSASGSTKHRLASARKELEQLRAEREEDREMITAIIKQRDMYRVLLAQADRQYMGGTTSSSSQSDGVLRLGNGNDTSTSDARRLGDPNDKRMLRELQREFDDYKKEKQANMKLLNESLDQARGDCSQAKVAQMQAQVESAHHKERFEALDGRYQDAEKEIVRLRAKTDQLSSLLLQHQQSLSDSEAKLETAMSQLQSLRVEKAGAVREAEFLRKHDEKMQQELTTLRLDNTNLLKLMEAGRKMDAAREQRDAHEIEAQTRKVASLEARLHELYDKLDAKEAIAGANVLAAEKEKQAVAKELEKLQKLHSELKEQVARLEAQKTSLEEKLAILEKENAHLREQLRKGTSAAAAERVATLEMQLRDAQREVQASLVARKSLADTATKYKAVAEANEKSLAELSAASEQWKQSEQAKLQGVEKQRDQIQSELRKARDELKEHILEGNKLREEIDRAEQSHKTALQQAVEQKKLMEIQAQGAQQQLGVVREELEKMKAEYSRVQDNYERELQLHAEEVSKASASRKLVEEERNLRVEKEQLVVALEAKVQTLEKEAQTQLDVLQKRLEDAAEAKSAILEQNKLLHSQLERAAVQVRRTHEEMLKKAADKPREDASADSSPDGAANAAHDKEVDDLRSVIAFLRRESEIASSKLELAQQEAQRHRAQIFSLESTIDRLREEIKALNAAAAAGSSTTTTPSSDTTTAEKRVAQLEQLSLLRESNATLRDENQKNLARLQQEEAKRKALEETLAPLQTSEAALNTLVDSLKQEIVTLNEANKRWKQRVEQLVEKYQQVDPAEHDAVVAERDTLKKEVTDVTTKLSTLEAEIETLRSTSTKTLEEERTKSENWSTQYERIKGFAKSWKTKAEALSKQLGEKNKESEARVNALSAQVTALTSEKNALETKLAASEASKQDSAAAASGASATWEKEKQELHVRLDAETKRATQLKDFNTRLMQGIKTLKKENSELKDQVQTQATVTVTSATPAVATTIATTASPAPSPPSASSTVAEAPKTEAPKPATVSAAPSTAASAPPVPATASIAPKVPVVVATPVPPAAAATTVAVAQEVVTKNTATATSTAAAVTTTTSSTTSSTGAVTAATPPVAAPAPPSTSVTPASTAAVTSTTVTAVAKSSPPLPPTPAPAASAAPTNPPAAPAAATTTTAPAPTAVAEPSAEEKLRMFALQSMRRIPAAGARGGAGTPTKPIAVAAPSSSPPRPTPPPLQLEEKTAASSSVSTTTTASTTTTTTTTNPFLPPTGGFAGFASGGAGGLVFGKPGITLPVPTATSPAAETPSTVPVETEAKRRSLRLARFAAAASASGSSPAGLKRPLGESDDDSAPAKVARTGDNADSEATEATGEASAEQDASTE